MGKGILEVQLIDAKGLASTDFLGGDTDPYVLIQYRSQERKSSICRGAGQGSNPSWNETFKFVVHSPSGEHQHKLILKLMDHDTFTADDFMGEATINVMDVIALGMENGIGELRPCKHRVVLADGTYCGEIRVGVKFTTEMKEEEEEEELGGWKHSFRS
ncbi:elicitor-responsive protein 1 isoform X1 [Phoenix dactylifera]|uniref:Elicitor-responsive protein 1 isoform X1 n=1 Tax=Phoenix dactylifera TaxID=42345 RepID=A0A8B7BHK9_PHODC|nr:elicitor-responsive protein 1 isoform X1 [Phoenix dactylifera]XP_026657053.1 elicitor-responsive protein 1 isoform X1 [Phoenix dactylifera]